MIACLFYFSACLSQCLHDHICIYCPCSIRLSIEQKLGQTSFCAKITKADKTQKNADSSDTVTAKVQGESKGRLCNFEIQAAQQSMMFLAAAVHASVPSCGSSCICS
jgi:hypothetical protein